MIGFIPETIVMIDYGISITLELLEKGKMRKWKCDELVVETRLRWL